MKNRTAVLAAVASIAFPLFGIPALCSINVGDGHCSPEICHADTNR